MIGYHLFILTNTAILNLNVRFFLSLFTIKHKKTTSHQKCHKKLFYEFFVCFTLELLRQ